LMKWLIFVFMCYCSFFEEIKPAVEYVVPFFLIGYFCIYF